MVDIFVTDVTVRGIKRGCPATRGAFRRTHGGAHGMFVMRDVPAEFRLGAFTYDSLPAWVRFSSDTEPNGVDYGQECGIAVKLFLPAGASRPTQDFLLQNISYHFVDDAQQMFEVSQDEASFVASHPRTKEIFDAMDAPVGSVVNIPYWSTLPSRLGDFAVKYKLVPDADDTPPDAAIAPPPDYLAADLRRTLWSRAVHFMFCIQLQKEGMEIERAATPWSEDDSPPIPIADITLPKQDILTRGQADYVENLAFSPWHSLPEHEPLGSLQAARRAVYEASAAARRWANGIPAVEPTEPRAPMPPY